jgi:DNA polymerase III sliding clamp (beta) subunit (PCNA family)
MKINTKQLKRGLNTLFAAADGQKRINRVFIEGSKHNLRFIATNSHRLAILNSHIKEEQNFNISIPKQLAKSLVYLLSTTETEEVELNTDNYNEISIKIDDYSITFPNYREECVNYRKFIKNYEFTVEINKKSLIKSLEKSDRETKIRCCTYLNEVYSVLINPNEGLYRHREKGNHNSNIIINSLYLLQGLNYMPKEEDIVTLSYNLKDNTQPIEFKCKNFTYYIAPIVYD